MAATAVSVIPHITMAKVDAVEHHVVGRAIGDRSRDGHEFLARRFRVLAD